MVGGSSFLLRYGELHAGCGAAARRYDMMMHGDMKTKAKRIESWGITTVFADLGQRGHGVPADMTDRLNQSLDWLETPEPAPRSSHQR